MLSLPESSSVCRGGRGLVAAWSRSLRPRLGDQGGDLPGASQPAGHADPLELAGCCLQQRAGAGALPQPGVHQRLIEVSDGPQRACPLLLQHRTGLAEPVGGLIRPAVDRAQPGEGQPHVHGREPEVGRERLVAQGRLDRPQMVAAA